VRYIVRYINEKTKNYLAPLWTLPPPRSANWSITMGVFTFEVFHGHLILQHIPIILTIEILKIRLTPPYGLSSWEFMWWEFSHGGPHVEVPSLPILSPSITE